MEALERKLYSKILASYNNYMTAMNNSPDVLQKILQRKREQVAYLQQQTALEILKQQIPQAPARREFVAAIQRQQLTGRPAIIAEIKRASPSKGVIRADFNPAAIAHFYQTAGATCLSVLTDTDFFQGSNDDLKVARDNCSLPVLRKDFIVDPYQIYESRLIGADCILLIVAALNDQELKQFAELAAHLNLDVLVEVHTADELQRALLLNLPLIGINNRDLRTFKTDLQNTINLLPLIPKDKIVVTESGVFQRADIEFMQTQGVNTFLIGESLLREQDPGKKLSELMGI